MIRIGGFDDVFNSSGFVGEFRNVFRVVKGYRSVYLGLVLYVVVFWKIIVLLLVSRVVNVFLLGVFLENCFLWNISSFCLLLFERGRWVGEGGVEGRCIL